MEQLLVHLVVILVAEDNHNDLWVPEDAIGSIHHVVKQLLLHLIVVTLTFKFNESWLLNRNFELLASLHKVVVNAISSVIVGTVFTTSGLLVHHDPLILEKVDGLLNWEPLQSLLVHVHNLVRVEKLHLRCSHDEAV